MTKVRRGKSSWVSEAPIATRELNSSFARLEDAVPLSACGKERLKMGIKLRRMRQKMRPP
jgi:hypothetical protein